MKTLSALRNELEKGETLWNHDFCGPMDITKVLDGRYALIFQPEEPEYFATFEDLANYFSDIDIDVATDDMWEVKKRILIETLYP